MYKPSKNEREQFIQAVCHHSPAIQSDEPDRLNTFDDGHPLAKKLMRYGATYGRIQEHGCSSPDYTANMLPHMVKAIESNWDRLTERYEAKEKRIESQVKEICDRLKVGVRFQGDPRGHTIKLVFPDGYHTNWDGETVGVPTS